MPQSYYNGQYRLNCVNRDGTTVAPLPNATLDQATWTLNAPGSIVYTMGQKDPYIDIPITDVNEVQLWIQDQLMHWGFHNQEEQQPDQVKFTCPGLLGYYQFRFITNTSLYYGYGTDGETPLAVGVEQLQIMADVFLQKGYDWHMTVYPFTDSGVKRFRDYKLFEHRNIMDIFAEFPELADSAGNPTGFDFEIDISQPPLRQLRMYYPKKGITHTGLGLEWGRNITSYTNKVDGTKLANDLWMTGGSNGDIKFENHSSNAASIAQYGHFESIQSQSNENDVTTLQLLAQKYVTDHANPLQTPDFTVVEIPDKLLGVIHVGDTVPVKIKNGRTNINGLYRIQQIQWNPGPGNLKIAIAA